MGADASLREQAIRTECRDLVARTAYLLDAQDYEAFVECFTEDAQLTRPGGSALVGRADILASYRARPADRITRHQLTNTVVEVETPDAARAVSYVVVWSASAGEPVEAAGRKANARLVMGEFRDRLVRTPQGWRVSQRDAAFLMYRDLA